MCGAKSRVVDQWGKGFRRSDDPSGWHAIQMGYGAVLFIH